MPANTSLLKWWCRKSEVQSLTSGLFLGVNMEDGCWNCKYYDEFDEWCYLLNCETLSGEICDEHKRDLSSY